MNLNLCGVFPDPVICHKFKSDVTPTDFNQFGNVMRDHLFSTLSRLCLNKGLHNLAFHLKYIHLPTNLPLRSTT
jgi:hypothetical protein